MNKYEKITLKPVHEFINECFSCETYTTEMNNDFPSKIVADNPQADFTLMFQSKLTKMVDILTSLQDTKDQYLDSSAKNLVETKITSIIQNIEELNRLVSMESLENEMYDEPVGESVNESAKDDKHFVIKYNGYYIYWNGSKAKKDTDRFTIMKDGKQVYDTEDFIGAFEHVKGNKELSETVIKNFIIKAKEWDNASTKYFEKLLKK